MRYYDCLREMLRPLGVYDLDSGIGNDELIAEGKALDEIFFALEELEREAFLVTGESYGLEMYEEIVPSRPVSKTLSDRRRALEALVRIDGCGFTRDSLNETLRGCGVNVEVFETQEPGRLEVSFPGTWGVPDNFEALRTRIEQILPCHLEISYLFNYLNWEALAQLCSSWQELEGLFSCWKGLEAGGASV